MLPQHISVTACKIYKSRLRTTNVRNGHSILKHRSVDTRATMGYQLFNVFWNSACGADPSNDPNGRVKRLADVNTHIGGGTWNDPTYTLINIHGPTAAWMFGLMAVLAALAVVVWYLYRRRQRNLKRIVARHRKARWDAIGYHKNECSKIDHTRECDCRKEGYFPRRASNGGDIEEYGYRRDPIEM